MAQLIFKRGSLANLNNLAIKDGQFIVTTDEGALYVDNGSTRVRLGDFIVVENVAALPASGANRKAMYYCESENVLARWNGTDWTQINKQPTTAELKVRLGLDADGEVTAAIKAAKQAGDDAQTAVDDLTTYVGTIPNGEDGQPMAASVVAYINKKTDGIATSGNLEALGNRVSTVEGKVATIEGDYLKKADKEALAGDISKAQTAADNAQTHSEGVANDLGEHEADTVAHITAAEREAWNGKTTMAQVEAKGYLVAADIAGKADSTQVATDIAEAVKVEREAREAADTAINNKIGTVAEGTTIVKMIEEAQAADATARGELKDELEGKIGEKVAQSAYDIKMAALDGEDVRLAGLITDMDAAYKKADSDIIARVADLESDITGLSGAMHFKGVVDALPETTDGYSDGDTIIVGQKEYVVNGEAFVELGDVSAEVQRISDLEKAVGNAESGLVKGVADNAAAIAGEKTRAEAKEAELAAADATNLQAAKDYADGKIADLKIGDYAKQSDLDSHTGDTVAHITAEERTAWNASEKNAKDYADGLNSTMSARVDALELIDHDHANKAELDLIASGDKAKWDAAEAKAHEHANSAELAKIADGDVAKWNGAQAAAEATAAAALATAKSELEGKITAAETAAKGYADTEVGKVQTALDTYKTANDTAVAGKADKATTLAGYGITDAMTKTDIEAMLTWSEF